MNQRISNAWKVITGLAATDSGIPVKQKVKQIISRLTWELPNTAVGLVASLATTLLFRTEVRRFHGSTFVKMMNRQDAQGYHAGTIGCYIIGSAHSDPLLHHEYGHYLQSRRYGPAYLFIVAIPSFLSMLLAAQSHDNRWFEKDADHRGKMFVNGAGRLAVM